MARENYHLSKKDDCMVDIETLGTDDDSVILSIGALKFNAFSAGPIEITDDNSFYEVLHIPTQRGRTINAETKKWWESESRAAAWKQIDEFEEKVHITEALDGLWDFMATCYKGWGCAPSFDQKMLGHAMRTTGIKALKKGRNDLPIPFYNEMDVRTVEQFVFGEKYRSDNRVGTYHNALDDCLTQAKMVQEAFKVVRAGKEALGL